ncbi:hypothetical protein [Klebsiella variicola]|uniref:hypothetical protein n=1 Tax=Klebsiella variicola TaxID=244366 RepID=UPI0025522230|nr:hypothetical protein [Klebsiella variicola]MDK6227527.1 hypothetical protein [Klebsiella variicola]
MQLQQVIGSAPALAAIVEKMGKHACRMMHLMHARLRNGKIAEKWHKKTGIQVAG